MRGGEPAEGFAISTMLYSGSKQWPNIAASPGHNPHPTPPLPILSADGTGAQLHDRPTPTPPPWPLSSARYSVPFAPFAPISKLPVVDGVNASLMIAAACFGGDQSVAFDDCDVLAHFGISDGASNGSNAQGFAMSVDHSMHLASAAYDAASSASLVPDPIGSFYPAKAPKRGEPSPPVPPPSSSAAQRLSQTLASNSIGSPDSELEHKPAGALGRKRSAGSSKNLRSSPTATPAPRLAPAVAPGPSSQSESSVSWSKALERVAKSLDHASCVKSAIGGQADMDSVRPDQAPFATELDSGDVLSELSDDVLSEETFSSDAISAEGISEEDEGLFSGPMHAPPQKGHGEKHLIVQYDLTVRSMTHQLLGAAT